MADSKALQACAGAAGNRLPQPQLGYMCVVHECLSRSSQPHAACRAMNMTYQPPVPLLVPASMPAVPPDVVGLDLPNLGLMTPEEELSNQQLDHSVGSWQEGLSLCRATASMHTLLQRASADGIAACCSVLWRSDMLPPISKQRLEVFGCLR